MKKMTHEAMNLEMVQGIISFLREDHPVEEIRTHLNEYHDYDVAQALEGMTPQERRTLYRQLGNRWAAELFPYYEEPQELLEELPAQEAAAILEEMDRDDAADILPHMSKDFCAAMERELAPGTSQDLRHLLSYNQEEIGSFMSTNYIAIPNDLTVKEAMRELIRQSEENDNIATLYVVQRDGQFYGAIDLKDLILTREYMPLESCIIRSYPFVRDHDDLQESMDWIRDYEEDSLPVLDDQDRLIGVITVQDVVDYLEEESRQVYNKLAGISSTDSESEDLKEPVFTSVKKRLPWLVVLLFLGMFVSSVVGMFEGVVAQIAVLVCFQSLILDMAGNVGTQSLAVTIRVLMEEDVTFSEKCSLIWKEIRVGLINGSLLGGVSIPAIGLYLFFGKDTALPQAMAIALCVGISLLLAMVISSFSGTVIPLFFQKIKVDPAVASGPLITTVNDLVAVISYYGMAWLLLIQLLHLAG